MGKAIGYVRVSTDEQAASGLGLEAQEAAIRSYADRNGMELESVFRDEGISGSKGIDKRNGLLDALASLGKDDVLLVAKRDRLGRDMMLIAMLESMVAKKKARIVSASEEGTNSDDPTAVLMKRMIDAFSEYERLLIKARTKAAMRAKKVRGERYCRARMGYKIDGNRLERDEPEQRVIARIRELRAAGLTYRKIAETLTAEKIPTKSGGTAWQHSAVRYVLERNAA